MKEGYSLGFHSTTAWKCLECGHRQEAVDDEDWPFHCGKPMRIVYSWGLHAVEVAATNQENERAGGDDG